MENCEWYYSCGFDRWHTGCNDDISLYNDASPREYGFKFCPFCGRAIVWGEPQPEPEYTEEDNN